MTRALLDLPAHQRRRLAAALESGLLRAPFTPEALRSVAGLREAPEAVIAVLDRWEGLGVAGPAKAAWLRSLEEAEGRRERPEFVWSGPEVHGLHARGTRQALEQSLASARRSVWLSTYAFFDGPRAFEMLARRMDETPELIVTLLLNIERKRGDTTRTEDLVRRFADRFWNGDWPGARKPRVFYDPRSLEPGGPEGVLHAKALVIDDQIAFLTSANLTEAALDRNIEMGVLLRDRALAQTVVKHFRGLIERDRLLPLPSA